MNELVYLGLGLIVAAWLIQLLAAMKGRKEMRKTFLLVYASGALVLAYDGYVGGAIAPAVLNIATTILALAVLLKNK